MIIPSYEDTTPAGTLRNVTHFLHLNQLVVGFKAFDQVQPIVIIGIHGWQPKLVQPFVKLDSSLFCGKMAEAIRLKLNLGPNEGKITSIPLNGYGTVLDRRDTFLKQIQSNQTTSDNIKKAKTLFVVGHSQGVPVGALLLQKLIEVGLVNPDQQQICACFMAGISQGPASRLDVGEYVFEAVDDKQSAELFEFQTSSSKLSQTYRDATLNILKCGVKIVYFASGNDEGVPLHSSLYSNMNHPSIKRGIYVANFVYEEKKFIADLVRVLLRIRNNNYSDHGLLVLLSESLLGYLSDRGHSHLHDESEPYQYAVDHLNLSREYKGVDAKFTEFNYKLPEKPRKTYIPWSMRGLLTDEKIIIAEKLISDFQSLRQSFKSWSPSPLDLVAVELKSDLQPFGDDTEEQYIEVYKETQPKL
ncbi:10174_t:CDS:2 [Ambispora leptoticha]|uniref:10174_t:CDS:1 n=1 Tax=Ambispora leptoticha TaxID=144679 RepID=A0A9N8WMH7_9GLOM|nr:10174_t:CDS:2 [Ambispora leptoticha]